MLKFLVSCYMRFVLINIKTFNVHNLLSQYISKILSSIDYLKTLITPFALSVFSSSLQIRSSSHIDKMKSSLVSVSALVFSLLKNEWNSEEDWLVVEDMTETLMISTEEKIQLVKNERFLDVLLARKKRGTKNGNINWGKTVSYFFNIGS